MKKIPISKHTLKLYSSFKRELWLQSFNSSTCKPKGRKQQKRHDFLKINLHFKGQKYHKTKQRILFATEPSIATDNIIHMYKKLLILLLATSFSRPIFVINASKRQHINQQEIVCQGPKGKCDPAMIAERGRRCSGTRAKRRF